MLPVDEKEFLAFVGQDPDVVFLPQSSPNPDFRPIQNIESLAQQRSRLETIAISKRRFPLRANHVRKVNLREYDESTGDYRETGQLLYYIDITNAMAIEFTPSFIRADHVLTQGRIWVNTRFWEHDKLLYKGAEFEAWYDEIAKWLRRKFKRVKDIDGYLGMQAIQWYKNGGFLSTL